jgi:hypothetical protein
LIQGLIALPFWMFQVLLSTEQEHGLARARIESNGLKPM